MDISVNKQNLNVPEKCTVYELIHQILKQSEKGIAVAINNTIIPKKQWEEETLKQNDTILLITATQGG